MSADAPLTPFKNPYKRGKSRLLADLMMKGWTNDQILSYVGQNGLSAPGGRYRNGIDMKDLWNVRSDLKRAGMVDSDGFPPSKASGDSAAAPGNDSLLPIYPIEGTPGSDGKTPEQRTADASAPRGGSPQTQGGVGRPEWDLLTAEQIDRIPDPGLKMMILNYKTDREKLRQTLKPEYATRGEIDLFRGEVSTRMSGVEEKINRLLELAVPVDPVPEVAEEETEEVEDPEPEEEEPVAPSRPQVLRTAVNRMEAEAATDTEPVAGDDDLVEMKAGIIAKKNVGFTAKSLMLYDIMKSQGFEGNLADFVNTCISDAFKGRSIELAVIDKKVIR